MANQMIALGVRGPQLPNLAGAAAQYGNMMANMAVMKEKQAGIQRANAFRQLVSDPGFDPANPEHIKAAQSLDPAGAERIVSAADARRKANLEYVGQLTQQYRDRLAVIDPNDKAAYGALREEIVKAVPGWGSRLPTAEQWGPDARVRTLMKADDVISKTIATPTASVQFTPGGEAFGVTVGGMGAPRAEKVIVQSRAAGGGGSAATPPAAPATNAPARATRGSATTPQDLLEQGVDPNSIPSGNPLDPVAFTPGGEDMGVAAVQPLTVENAPQIIQTAIQNGVIDQSHVEQLRQMVGPENDAALAQWMRQNNVRIQPAGEPSLRSAVYRPGQDAAPQMQEAQTDTNAVGTQFIGRDPMQSPMPGSAIVPLPRVRGQAAAEEGGQQGVRVVTQPKIVAGEERAKRLEKLRGELPRARSDTDTFVSDLTRKIQAIDAFLRNPHRNSIIGPIEGNLPDFAAFGERGNALAQWKFITDNATLQKLIDDRKATETGASPQGIVSDRDLELAARAASQVTRMGTLGFNDNELQRVRDVWYAARERALRTYNDTYRDVMEPGYAIQAPYVAPKYKRSPVPKPLPQDIEYLQRNRSNPDVVNGFRKHFGEQAFRQYMGGR